MRLPRIVALLALASGCSKDNPNYDGSSDVEPDADDTTGPACENNDDCMATSDTPVCHMEVCVQCTLDNQQACSPSLVCGEDNRCRPCESNGECLLSGACLADGMCADPNDVAYVAAGGTNPDCLKNAPCATLGAALLTDRSVIKLQGDDPIDGSTPARLTDRAIEIVADAGVTIASAADSVIRLDGPQAKATISDLTIIGAQVPVVTIGAFSVSDVGGTLVLHHVTVNHHQGPAVRAGSGDVTIDRCTFAENTGGGIHLDGARFTVTSSLIVHNGASQAEVGGVLIANPEPGSTFAFNTISSNVTTNLQGTGIECADAFPISSSIVRNNGVSTSCDVTYTLFMPPLSVPGGTGNVSGDPMFLTTDPMNYAQPDFFRIDEASAAQDVAETNSPVTTDIDGEPRAAAPDMGADER